MESAVLLSTGDELVTGRIVDTNSAYIAEKLYSLGIPVSAILKLGDDRPSLLWSLARAVELGSLLIGTGGLGPTADDLTNETVAAFLGRGLRLHEDVVANLRRRAESRGQAWTPNNAKQALLPEGSEIVPNPVGTAPGFRLDLGNSKTLFWLPGVPREMEAMLRDTVLPWVSRQLSPGEGTASLAFKIYGLTESQLDDALKGVRLPDSARLSFRVHFPDLTVRLSVSGKQRDAEIANLATQIRSLIGSHVYAEGDKTLEEIVGRLLLEHGWTLALAESCTGGYLSHRVTRVAGSSAYFKSAAVTYSNEAKVDLGVATATIETYGPVSSETAREMALAIRQRAATDIGLSVTGVAGPSGGTDAIPVGTVWIGMSHSAGTQAQRLHFAGDRERVILGASQAALYWLRTHLAGHGIK
jgi:nicotinamide-nucleotide amidase